MRGEYLASSFPAYSSLELPPRARRIPLRFFAYVQDFGTTSACAENTNRFHAYIVACRNYLRVRGEYSTPRLVGSILAELPPRARRIRWVSLAMMGCTGTTSACAENTAYSACTLPVLRNYLRVRGEYYTMLKAVQAGVELPPRARRIHSGFTSPGYHIGTTSACAENTCPAQCFSSHTWNYLRVRGEYNTHKFPFPKRWELPPRARRILPECE